MMDHMTLLWGNKMNDLYSNFFVLKPDWLFLFQSMKRKQKSCQNEPSAGRFDAPHTRFEVGLLRLETLRFNPSSEHRYCPA